MKRAKHFLLFVVVIGACSFTSCTQYDDTNYAGSLGERLPNYECGPGRPRPNYLNFYRIDDRFPYYLLCEYPVKEEHYDQSSESGWFKASLEQIRHFGPKKFPAIKWIAVTIRNVAEHKDASTFEQSFKVGAIFSANEVFDSSRNLSQLVVEAKLDRHPFMYDTTRKSYDQQRWLIVERHAAAINAATGSNRDKDDKGVGK